MKNRMTRALALCLLLTLLAGALSAAFAEPVIADYVLWMGCGPYMLEFSEDLPDDAGSFAVNSGNKSVVKATCKDRNNVSSVQLTPLKPGKSMITLTYKSAGTYHKVSKLFNVKKYPKAFSYIKVNGKKINLSKNKGSVQYRDYDQNTILVSFKAGDGWAVDVCTGTRFRNGTWSRLTWQNGKSVDLKGNVVTNLAIYLHNRKTGDRFDYLISISR